MSDRNIRLTAAIVVPIAALLVANWYDGSVLTDIRMQAGRTFDMKPLAYGSTLAYLLTGIAAVAIAAAAWRSRSPIVGLAYLVVGGFIVSLPALFVALALGDNGAAPLAPEPIARFITERYLDLSGAVTGSVFTLGAVMFVSGVAVVAAAILSPRRVDADAKPPVTGTATNS